MSRMSGHAVLLCQSLYHARAWTASRFQASTQEAHPLGTKLARDAAEVIHQHMARQGHLRVNRMDINSLQVTEAIGQMLMTLHYDVQNEIKSCSTL